MDYDIKIKIGDTELYESDDPNSTEPFISNVIVKDSTALDAMAIGATASNALYFTMYNPFQLSFDGERVELFISANSDTSTDDLGDIADYVGDETADDAIDENDVDALEDDTTDGEELTPEEIADADAVEGEEVGDTFEFFDGETDTIVDVQTEEEEEPDWVRLGVYWVYSQNASDNNIRFECLDGLSQLNGDYIPPMASGTVQAFYNDYVQQAYNNLGVTVDPYEFTVAENINITWGVKTSYRDAIGYFAGLVGGYATFGDDDTLGISFYAFNDSIVLDDRIITLREDSAGEFIFDGLVCDRSTTPYKDDIIEVGAGQGIRFANPFVTPDILNGIYEYYKGTKYNGGSLSLVWDDTIRAGQFIRVMSPDEYANYIRLTNAYDLATDPDELLGLKAQLNDLGRVYLVSNQTINFTGEATSTITSICGTEYAKENKTPAPGDAAFKKLYAEMIEAEYLRAKGAFIADLTAENLKVDSINGKAIKNSAVLAKALSGEMIETYLGVKVFYQAEEPTAENVGDIWYLTVAGQDYDPMTDVIKTWDGTAWVEQQFDTPRSIFMANSIIAQDINTNSLATNQAFIDKLFAQNIEATNFNLKGGSVNISTEYSGYDYIALRYLLSTRGEYYRMAVDPQRMEFVVDSTGLSGGLEVNPFGVVVQNSSPDSMRIAHNELTYGADGLRYSVWGELAKLADIGVIAFEETGTLSNPSGRVRITAKDGLCINDHNTPIGTNIATNGTKSIATGSMTDIGSIDLEAGSYIVTCTIYASMNAGTRIGGRICVGSVNDSDAYVMVSSHSASTKYIECVRPIVITEKTTIRFMGYQNNGSNTTMTWRANAMRIA